MDCCCEVLLAVVAGEHFWVVEKGRRKIPECYQDSLVDLDLRDNPVEVHARHG